MAGTLDKWQERLDRHFGDLASSRASSGFPIFALEHGLGASDLQEITSLLHSYLNGNQRLSAYWLLWVVYATEQGYGYDGHEFWDSFKENTPRWHERGRDYYLREYFSKFQKTYNGVVPSGPWAEWFKNISGPITHAVLPRYLQLQFASSMYEARHQLARMQNPTPASVGKLLASSAWDATSRFQEFLEQEELAGRIVLALLDYGIAQEQSPIYAPTLKRIVTDLEVVRKAGEWLKETRRFVTDRFHGVDRSATGGLFDREGVTARPSEPPSVRPNLLLRRSGEATWSVVAEVPNFGGIARLSPEMTQFLKSTRCSIAGADNAMLPAGWTLYGPQRRVMKSWPPSGAPMITFERQNAVLENILRSECRFSQGPVWVFRIGADGLAHEITGRTVRAGQRYVVLSPKPIETKLGFAAPAGIECVGVTALVLNMPADGIQAEETAELRKIGIEVARNIRVWPAGLCIRNWDGEGHGDWLTSETPCFGIVHDYAVDEYSIRLNGGSELKIDGARAGQPVFVRLQPLPPGRHSVSVRAKRIGLPTGSAALKDLEGKIQLKVRDPAPWKPGTTSYSGLSVTIDPPDPSLDSFWEGNVQLAVLGPEGRDVSCSIALTGRNGVSVLSQEIGKFDLPIVEANWSKRFKQFANDDSRAWKHLEASTGRFVIKGEELGEYTLQLERDSKPVRWICRITPQAVHVRLVDDTGREDTAEVTFFPLKHPGSVQAIDTASAMTGINVEEPGGLFLAQQSELKDMLIVSSSKGASDFAGLIVEPDMTGLGSDLTRLLALIELWQQARIVGPLAESRRALISNRLLERLYTTLCGSRWAHAEAFFFLNPRSRNFDPLERAIECRSGFPAALRLNYSRMSLGATVGAKWFAEAAHRYEVCDDAQLCTLALRLASRPTDLGATYGEEVTGLLSNIADYPILMRAARYFALLSIAADEELPAPYLPRWPW
jgi:hypothetical protein